MKTCANCHRTIGDLETPRFYEQQIVCAECDARLRNATTGMPPRARAHVPLKATDFNPVRVVLALAVVAGIVIIILLLIEWVRRNDLINSVGG